MTASDSEGRSRQWEARQRALDPDRDSDRARVAAEVASRLTLDGVELTGDESSDELADLRSATDRFQAAVSSLGGDRMVDDPHSSKPYTARFVIPARYADESARRYADRITRAAESLEAEA